MSKGLLEPTERTRVRRYHERGSYDRDVIDSILDATPLCHVGYDLDGRPSVTPTFHWRVGDAVYWHGSSASRALRAAEGADVCLTVTLLDALVLARSAFHHSANYRSVMLFGQPTRIVDAEEKREVLRHFVEGLYPGRWETLRPVTYQELKVTTVLRLPIEEASAKVRSGPPVDAEPDRALPIWAGLMPVRQLVGPGEPDAFTPDDAEDPFQLGDLTIG